MQLLHKPMFYKFDRTDIGRIVLFKCEKELALYPFMVMFNRDQVTDEDDDLVYRHLLTDQIFTINQLLGECGYEYVEIIQDSEDLPFGTPVQRKGDMDKSVLQTFIEEDGDICLSIHNGSTDSKTFQRTSIQFCTIGMGGGKSPRTLKALRELVVAMSLDNQDPFYKGL